MRSAALVLGIVGGIIGVFMCGGALARGGIGAVAGAQHASPVIGSGWAALGASVVGIVGAAFAMAQPRPDGHV